MTNITKENASSFVYDSGIIDMKALYEAKEERGETYSALYDAVMTAREENPLAGSFMGADMLETADRNHGLDPVRMNQTRVGAVWRMIPGEMKNELEANGITKNNAKIEIYRMPLTRSASVDMGKDDDGTEKKAWYCPSNLFEVNISSDDSSETFKAHVVSDDGYGSSDPEKAEGLVIIIEDGSVDNALELDSSEANRQYGNDRSPFTRFRDSEGDNYGAVKEALNDNRGINMSIDQNMIPYLNELIHDADIAVEDRRGQYDEVRMLSAEVNIIKNVSDAKTNAIQSRMNSIYGLCQILGTAISAYEEQNKGESQPDQKLVDLIDTALDEFEIKYTPGDADAGTDDSLKGKIDAIVEYAKETLLPETVDLLGEYKENFESNNGVMNDAEKVEAKIEEDKMGLEKTIDFFENYEDVVDGAKNSAESVAGSQNLTTGKFFDVKNVIGTTVLAVSDMIRVKTEIDKTMDPEKIRDLIQDTRAFIDKYKEETLESTGPYKIELSDGQDGEVSVKFDNEDSVIYLENENIALMDPEKALSLMFGIIPDGGVDKSDSLSVDLKEEFAKLVIEKGLSEEEDVERMKKPSDTSNDEQGTVKALEEKEPTITNDTSLGKTEQRQRNDGNKDGRNLKLPKINVDAPIAFDNKTSREQEGVVAAIIDCRQKMDKFEKDLPPYMLRNNTFYCAYKEELLSACREYEALGGKIGEGEFLERSVGAEEVAFSRMHLYKSSLTDTYLEYAILHKDCKIEDIDAIVADSIFSRDPGARTALYKIVAGVGRPFLVMSFNMGKMLVNESREDNRKSFIHKWVSYSYDMRKQILEQQYNSDHVESDSANTDVEKDNTDPMENQTNDVIREEMENQKGSDTLEADETLKDIEDENKDENPEDVEAQEEDLHTVDDQEEDAAPEDVEGTKDDVDSDDTDSQQEDGSPNDVEDQDEDEDSEDVETEQQDEDDDDVDEQNEDEEIDDFESQQEDQDDEDVEGQDEDQSPEDVEEQQEYDSPDDIDNQEEDDDPEAVDDQEDDEESEHIENEDPDTFENVEEDENPWDVENLKEDETQEDIEEDEDDEASENIEDEDDENSDDTENPWDAAESAADAEDAVDDNEENPWDAAEALENDDQSSEEKKEKVKATPGDDVDQEQQNGDRGVDPESADSNKIEDDGSSNVENNEENNESTEQTPDISELLDDMISSIKGDQEQGFEFDINDHLDAADEIAQAINALDEESEQTPGDIINGLFDALMTGDNAIDERDANELIFVICEKVDVDERMETFVFGDFSFSKEPDSDWILDNPKTPEQESVDNDAVAQSLEIIGVHLDSCTVVLDTGFERIEEIANDAVVDPSSPVTEDNVDDYKSYLCDGYLNNLADEIQSMDDTSMALYGATPEEMFKNQQEDFDISWQNDLDTGSGQDQLEDGSQEDQISAQQQAILDMVERIAVDAKDYADNKISGDDLSNNGDSIDAQSNRDDWHDFDRGGED